MSAERGGFPVRSPNPVPKLYRICLESGKNGMQTRAKESERDVINTMHHIYRARSSRETPVLFIASKINHGISVVAGLPRTERTRSGRNLLIFIIHQFFLFSF